MQATASRQNTGNGRTPSPAAAQESGGTGPSPGRQTVFNGITELQRHVRGEPRPLHI